jgi:branched-chain amino acid transport system substrate-binding protein
VRQCRKDFDKVGSPIEGKAAVAAMRVIAIDDPLFGKGTVRLGGRKIHPLYLLRVRAPEESKSKWDLLKVVAVIPGRAGLSLESEGNCLLIKK